MLAIRKIRLIPLLAALTVLVIFVLVIAGVSHNRTVMHKAEDFATFAVAEPAPPTDTPPPGAASAPALAVNSPAPPQEVQAPGESEGSADLSAMTPVEVTVPKLAYAYELGFRLSGDRIAKAQDAHRAACERMGPARCQLLGMSRGAAEDQQTDAHLKLRVASAEARRFSDEAIKVVAKAGGRAIKTSVTAEDVSKEIVDAEARIHQRELLVARLTEILRTRSGKVAELVEAERSVAQAQEELDQTKGWLTELRGRVAMSDLDITYTAVAPTVETHESGNQLGDAIVESLTNFVIGIKGLLTVLIFLLPWLLLLALPLWFGWHKFRRAERTEPPVQTAEEDPQEA